MSKTDEDVEDLPLDTPSETTGVQETERTETTFSEYEDEEEEEETEKEIEEEEVYYSEDFISRPFLSEGCTIEEDILVFDHSYGYDCKRYYNLHVADEKTLIFASGNLIHIFDIEHKQLKFRRSAFGCGIGHIKKNPDPTYQHIAIAEHGDKPPIIIYEWPSFEIFCLLKGGAEKNYSHLDYSPNGDLLVSQAGEPDYLITVWNWSIHKILLRTKSYMNDVFVCKFSPFVPGQLATCGMSHIKFWKMASTFTGLKLQGELGRFGKTEYSDIVAIIPMPDEKVVSGCSWGNMLVWDEGLIRIEVYRKDRKNCHNGAIMQVTYKNGELWTAALDGYIRVWYYEMIDQANPPDEDRVIMLQPAFEFCVPGAAIISYVNQYESDPKNSMHFAQDGNGGIWHIDLNTESPLDARDPVQLYKCHAGAVADMAACPWGNYFASLGVDGRFYLYNYVSKKMIFDYQFPAKGVCLLWLPLTVEASGDEIILGFDDGNLRSVILTIPNNASPSLSLYQINKPHHKPITTIALNLDGTLLLTGSEDNTVFLFQILYQKTNYTSLIPIGYVRVPDQVTCITWHKQPTTRALIGCLHGQFMEVDLPKVPQDYTKITYLLYVNTTHKRFTTYKAQIRRDIKIKEIEARKAKKVEKKRAEMEIIKRDNPGLDIDEDVFLEDSESEEELEPLHIPEIPNTIFWMQITPEDTIWLSMGGYDAGYIYEYTIDQKGDIPFMFKMVDDADDTEISSFVYNHNGKYHIMAMQNGAIRINKVNPTDFRDLSNYWQLSMHDNHRGFIPKMCFSYDEKYFFTCGEDGNVFSYKFNPEDNEYIKNIPPRMRISKKLPHIDDEDNYETLSLEETIVKAEEDRIQALANQHMEITREEIKALKERFDEILKRNKKLLPTQVIPRKELEVDPRVTKDLHDQLDADLALVKRKLAFDVEKSTLGLKKLLAHFTDPLGCFPITVYAVRSDLRTTTLRQRKLGSDFYSTFRLVEQKIIEEEIKGRPPERPPAEKPAKPPRRKKGKKLEYFLMGLSPSTIATKLNRKLQMLLDKYRKRKAKWEQRQIEWDDFNFRKPKEGVTHAEDEAALQEAQETIGDYKLKSSVDYTIPKQKRETKLKKFLELLKTREQQYNIRHKFNMDVHKMRERKAGLTKYLTDMYSELESIHKEIPKAIHKFGPGLPKTYEDDYIDKNLEVNVEIPKLPEESEDTISEPPKIIEVSNIDTLQREVLNFEGMPHLKVDKVLKDLENDNIKNTLQLDIKHFLMQAESEVKETPWEKETKANRMNRKIFEQSTIIDSMEHEIEVFDNAISDMIKESCKVKRMIYFIDAHLLTLNQELNILKDFEAVEEELSMKVNAILQELIDMEEIISKANKVIEERSRYLIQVQDKEKEINEHFQVVVQNNKFYKFLRRIFRKKYHPPKQHTGDSDSDSESSSSSEESDQDDAGSVDSRDFGIIKLDENVCPKGCDRAIYDLTFELRTKRHAVELKIKDEIKLIETLKKEMEVHLKKLRTIEGNLKNSQEELELFQREKQKKLNTVITTAVLKLHQLEHLISESETAKITDCLIFSKKTLSKLYKRVSELEMEINEQKAKHEVNKKHMMRMKRDIKVMTQTTRNVKRDIIDAMKIRFGQVVDIDEVEENKIMDTLGIKFENIPNVDDMEEALLKSIVHDLRLNTLDIAGLYRQEIQLWKKRHEQKQIELKKIITSNTERVELLTLLKSEKNELQKLVSTQSKKRDSLTQTNVNIQKYKEELAELSAIVKNQKKQLDELREEIKRLSTKGLVLKPKEKKAMAIAIEEESDEWMDFDEYMDVYGEYYLKQIEAAKFKKSEIKIPTIFTEKSENVIKDILEEMLECLDMKLAEDVVQEFIHNILATVAKRCSVAEIIEDILTNLPLAPTEDQQSIVEVVAEKLFAIEEPEVTEDEINKYTSELLQEILDNTMLIEGHPYEVMVRMIGDLVEQLPIDFLNKDDTIDLISDKVKEKLSDTVLNKKMLIHSVESISSAQREEMGSILDKILENVFGKGIDYLYVINN